MCYCEVRKKTRFYKGLPGGTDFCQLLNIYLLKTCKHKVLVVNGSHLSAWEMKAGGSELDPLCYVVSGGQCGKQESLSQTNKQSKGWEGSYCVLFLHREKDSGLSSFRCLPLFSVLGKPYLFGLEYTQVWM